MASWGHKGTTRGGASTLLVCGGAFDPAFTTFEYLTKKKHVRVLCIVAPTSSAGQWSRTSRIFQMARRTVTSQTWTLNTFQWGTRLLQVFSPDLWGTKESHGIWIHRVLHLLVACLHFLFAGRDTVALLPTGGNVFT